jgi:hypothetical protein
MTKVRSALIVCALAAGAFASTKPAVAQFAVGTVNVPFAFHIDQQEMPAGLYRIDHESSSLYMLRGSSRSGMVLTHPTAIRKVPAQGFVVFHRIGNAYFLGGLWSAGDNHTMQCFRGKAETQMLQESNQQVPSLTMLAVSSTPRR